VVTSFNLRNRKFDCHAVRGSRRRSGPVEIVTDETVITTSEAADKRIDLESEWLRYCEHDAVFNSSAVQPP
jgi:hypothetical protein